jgi:hypothetical protein
MDLLTGPYDTKGSWSDLADSFDSRPISHSQFRSILQEMQPRCVWSRTKDDLMCVGVGLMHSYLHHHQAEHVAQAYDCVIWLLLHLDVLGQPFPLTWSSSEAIRFSNPFVILLMRCFYRLMSQTHDRIPREIVFRHIKPAILGLHQRTTAYHWCHLQGITLIMIMHPMLFTQEFVVRLSRHLCMYVQTPREWLEPCNYTQMHQILSAIWATMDSLDELQTHEVYSNLLAPVFRAEMYLRVVHQPKTLLPRLQSILEKHRSIAFRVVCQWLRHNHHPNVMSMLQKLHGSLMPWSITTIPGVEDQVSLPDCRVESAPLHQWICHRSILVSHIGVFARMPRLATYSLGSVPVWIGQVVLEWIYFPCNIMVDETATLTNTIRSRIITSKDPNRILSVSPRDLLVLWLLADRLDIRVLREVCTRAILQYSYKSSNSEWFRMTKILLEHDSKTFEPVMFQCYMFTLTHGTQCYDTWYGMETLTHALGILHGL